MDIRSFACFIVFLIFKKFWIKQSLKSKLNRTKMIILLRKNDFSIKYAILGQKLSLTTYRNYYNWLQFLLRIIIFFYLGLVVINYIIYSKRLCCNNYNYTYLVIFSNRRWSFYISVHSVGNKQPHADLDWRINNFSEIV